MLGIMSLLVLLLGIAVFLRSLGLIVIGKWKVTFQNGITCLIIAIAAAYGLASIIIIEPGDRGAIFNVFSGVQNRNMSSGMHFVPAIFNKVEIYDVYTKTYTEVIDCLSKDGLPVSMDVSIRFRLCWEVDTIFKNVGTEKDVEEKILIPTARSKMRDIAAEFSAQEAYALKRMEMQMRYEELLKKIFGSENYIVPEQILIRKITPPTELTNKITETKVSEQEIVNQENILTSKRIKKEQTIVVAQAEAESLRIKGQSVTNNPKVALLQWIDKWDGHLPNFLMDGKSNGVMFNMSDLMGKKE